MKVLIQRVQRADVQVAGQVAGAIGRGALLFVGIERGDGPEQVVKMAEKVLAYRLFSDHQGKMNLNVKQVDGGLLVVSQFTLAADTQKGLRPSFSSAAAPPEAEMLFRRFVEHLSDLHESVEQGIFAADMQVTLVNDGPVTFLLEG